MSRAADLMTPSDDTQLLHTSKKEVRIFLVAQIQDVQPARTYDKILRDENKEKKRVSDKFLCVPPRPIFCDVVICFVVGILCDVHALTVQRVLLIG